MLKIYNTLKREKEEFKPINPNQVGMYVCGVTVYDLCHFGHGRTFVSFDVIARYLRYLGYNLRYVRNITDVDDKIIKRALENNETCDQLVDRMIAEMHKDFDDLNILRPDVEPRATKHIPEIVAMVEKLIANGHAYVAADGDVMFDVESFKKYGALSRQNLEQLQAGARVEIKSVKKNPMDFVLWKMSKEGEPSWQSPWGNGRPGWHIECSAMNSKELGEHFDIHGGGSDLMFPHHENEIAQSCCAHGGDYVNYWLHTGMLTIDDEKMSKSLGNFFTIRTMLEKYESETLRYFFLTAHYRSLLNYSLDNLDLARSALERLYTSLRGCDLSVEVAGGEQYVEAFKAAMDDDFNTPGALAVLFEIAREVNKLKTEDMAKANGLAVRLKELAGVLGLLYQDPEAFLQGDADNDEVAEIEALIKQRNEAKAAKNWAVADEVRDKLKAMNIVLEDTPNGTTWRKA
ncbi:cysteinyl-tRNA synthetase [Actinobacillus pleuropneumoniae]|uniref:Cysteine--tRNA ligase n=1 Tax=Actinobacillus pleuropneumoniae serotype 5b (strain L20) TaxID=416269 RepID=SYC_ACTP2|nr:cysteine--tRNA ligase [Actinobacillus pleuropneumoniae]A3N0S3.1 RecName: Full=Cysteine--tRNA ligase; AltName: Full=Cysteinyl-tRNA synthetase; Short=CysRS [Actinobacillus pleuropneumoniae serovar 5b str. L20]ABN74009.1 cysteinyl-tRNA synthetase [Actinobacillus pleuropneumoniae serovar 5b str. L20]MEE3682261.1 cysteine--tRNA ligase [Actinobacillus pleuropneumoniae]QSZ38941.1 cysteinyl-tRNA synthetase [Actinobacillus pleuropneumoniae]UKH10872.1 cysteine--tRNA ligase [Actinobacillus pleuropneum